MTLIFGLHLDDLTAPRPTDGADNGTHYCGPKKLLALLESHLGLTGHEDDIDFLRVEQYRQAILSWQSAVRSPQSADEGQPDLFSIGKQHFFQKSFEADQFATATELLSRRDELLLAGFSFSENLVNPPGAERLAVLCEIEAIFADGPACTPKAHKSADSPPPLELAPGFADRFCEAIKKLETRPLPFTKILLNEPLDLLPCHFQRLFRLTGCEQLPAHFSEGGNTDLEKFRNRLLPGGEQKDKTALANDGSLLIIRAKRANEAATFIAQMLRLNPGFRPNCLVPEKNRTLDIALVQEGLPSLGIQSASLARPALQILKLAPTFLWWPIDPFKILEFASLALKPLPEALAERIGEQIARSPGLQGEGWYAMVNRYFAELENSGETAKTVAAQREQYNFWFERQRHPMDGTVPKREVLEIFVFLRNWAKDVFEENNGKNHSLIVLSEQCRRITELLQALPETELGFLQLERIVRTIYEPSPVVFQERAKGHLPYFTHPGAITDGVDEVLWWNFVEHEPPHFFSRWYRHERSFLASQNIHLDTPERQNARTLWQRTRPVLLAQKRLVLVVPEVVDGATALPHPLLGDLEAAFDNLESITLDTRGHESPVTNRKFKFPKKESVPAHHLGRPKPFLQLENLDNMEPHAGGREYETLTSLESLFYYPYQWVFRYKAGLRASSILSVVKDHTLMGNLAHRVFEKLLREEKLDSFDKPKLDAWVDENTRKLFAREGAVLLMYGREPERIAFVNKLKYSVWSLVSHLRQNGWRVHKTEMELEGHFPTGSDCAVRGIADLVVERDGPGGATELAVIDLKWRGGARRTNILKNGEDLQLVLYARLLSENGKWPHTSYYIIENGKLLARNNLAFRGITPLAPEADHTEVNNRILAAMEATWHWRKAQLAAGKIEIRCRQTLSEIEETYGEEHGAEMYDILEMKSEDAPWDDYRTLIDLVD